MPAETQGKEVNLAYQWVPACPSTDEIDLSNHVVDERAPSVSSIPLRTPSSKCQNLIQLRMLQPLGDNPPLGVTWLVQAFHAVFQCIFSLAFSYRTRMRCWIFNPASHVQPPEFVTKEGELHHRHRVWWLSDRVFNSDLRTDGQLSKGCPAQTAWMDQAKL